MAFKKYLSTQERTKILSLKKKGISVHAISREIHRSRATISKFIKNPEEYIKNIKTDNKYEILNNSLDKSIKSTKSNDTTPKKSTKITTSTPSLTASNKKIIRKSYDSSKKKFADDDIKRFNRVSVEYRAVIKYLIKKGIGPRFIYEDIKKVYGSIAPDLQSILYWAKQYQQGRQTIVNEPANKQTTSPLNKTKTPLSSTSKSKNITNTSKMLSSPSKQVKLFKFKFKPVKRLSK